MGDSNLLSASCNGNKALFGLPYSGANTSTGRSPY